MNNKTFSLDCRRVLSRTAYDCCTELEQGERCWNTSLIDLSLNGLLVEHPENWTDNVSDLFHATIRLEDGSVIEMDVVLTHSENHSLGFRCVSIDFDNLSSLRHMLESGRNEGEVHMSVPPLAD